MNILYNSLLRLEGFIMKNEDENLLKIEYDAYLIDRLFKDIDTIIDTRIICFEDFCKRKLINKDD